MADSQVIDWITLSLIPGLGSKTIFQLLDHFGDPESLFRICQEGGKACAGIRPQLLSFLSAPEQFKKQAISLCKRLENGGARAVCPVDAAYPILLKQIADPPAVLYLQGNSALLNLPCVAMVGSRAATAYGKRTAYKLASDLARTGVTVVSGLALGIDGESHKGALSVGGGTVGVLGCGLDVVYPRQNKELYKKMRREALLITEYPLGVRPDGFRFPARNRIVAGLCRGVVVVEAAKKSGSLITAGMALDEGRDVFAVPGQIDSFKSSGTHWLLQQGAKLVQSAEDVLVEMETLAKGSESSSKMSHVPPRDLGKDASSLLEKIEVYPCSRSDLIVRSGLSSAKVAELLLLLELEGLVEIVPGDEVRRVVN